MDRGAWWATIHGVANGPLYTKLYVVKGCLLKIIRLEGALFLIFIKVL